MTLKIKLTKEECGEEDIKKIQKAFDEMGLGLDMECFNHFKFTGVDIYVEVENDKITTSEVITLTESGVVEVVSL